MMEDEVFFENFHNRLFFHNERFKDMAFSLMEKLNVIVHPDDVPMKMVDSSNKENGKFVFMESEFTDDLGRTNEFTLDLSLKLTGKSRFIFHWFIDAFPNLQTLSLKLDQPMDLKPLDKLKKLQNFTLNRCVEDLASLNVINLKRLTFIHRNYMYDDKEVDLSGFQKLFLHHQLLSHVKICVFGDRDQNQSHHNGIVKCALENLPNLSELIIESEVEEFGKPSQIKTFVKAHAKVGFVLKFTNDAWERIMTKRSENEVVESKEPKILMRDRDMDNRERGLHIIRNFGNV